jgi:hypothetical protein
MRDAGEARRMDYRLLWLIGGRDRFAAPCGSGTMNVKVISRTVLKIKTLVPGPRSK